jgi:hypothetical protein
LKIFEDLTMFEQRILCHKLPKSIDAIKIDIDSEQQGVNKHNKIIQELKRRMLNVELEQYEMKIQQYEQSYQQDLSTFQLQILNQTSSDQKSQVNKLMDLVKSYLTLYTNRLICRIRFKESRLHVKLIRCRRRRALLKKKIIDVYPQIIVDVRKVSLNRVQLDYLSRNGKCKLISPSHFNNSFVNIIYLSFFFCLFLLRKWLCPHMWI